MTRHPVCRIPSSWSLVVVASAFVFVCPGIRAAESDAGGTYAAWLEHRERTLQDRSLLRYYDFQDVRDSGTAIRNHARDQKPLVPGLAQRQGNAGDRVVATRGRWPGKKAARLDQVFLGAEAWEPAGKLMTVEAWLRENGPGVLRGNSGATNGALLSVGGGYWDGWRLTFSYPARTIGFEIGRAQPSHSVGIHTGPVGDGVWHHVAATWDGQEMRIYVDGFTAAAGKYAGEYTPPRGAAQFRIGYANAGFGSVQLDVDEVAVYGRALSAQDILRHAHFYAPLPESAAKAFAAGDQCLLGKDYAGAAAAFGQAFRTADLAPDYQAVARLRAAEACLAAMKSRQAVAHYARVLEVADVAARHRVTAQRRLLQLIGQVSAGDLPRSSYETLLAMDGLTPHEKLTLRWNLARGCREEKQFAAAREQYQTLLNMAELTPRDRLNIGLELGHTAMESKDYPAARSQYAKIAGAADAPGHYRSMAQLRVAQTYVREENLADAKAEYARLQTMPDVPPHHRWEASERMLELDRVAAGLPARDPQRSRTALPKWPKPALTLYVATDGSDTNPGTKDRPLASPQQAQKRILAAKQSGALASGGATVYLRAGTYRLKESWNLAAEDSGTEQAPIVYRALEGETVRLSGSVSLSGFKAVVDPKVLAQLEESARAKVVQLDLRSLGITRYGSLTGQGKRPELFFNGRPMTLARWPNRDYLRVGDLKGQKTIAMWGTIRGTKDGKFTYDGDRPNRWKAEREVWLYGFWFWDWADSYQRVASIDTQNRVFTIAPPDSHYGYRKGQRYYALNLLSEIDEPGEWYLDRTDGILYFYPPAELANASVELAMLETPMVQMKGVSHVTLRGLTLEAGRGYGVTIEGGDRCLVAGCTLRNLGEYGVMVRGGRAHGVFGCDIHTLGRGGVHLEGGDRKTLAPGQHFVENCHIHDFSRIWRTYTPAVQMEGCGNRIAHNLFHHSPHHAMRVEGNDHHIEFNEIHSVVWDSDDQGGLDMFYNPGYRGNVIRYNFWHHIGSGLGHGIGGVRLDDAICGVLIYGNVFYRTSDGSFGGVQIHGGKENIVDNNLFVDCKYSVSFSPWGEKRWREMFTRPEMVHKLTQEVDVGKPPYSTRYPELARLTEKPDVNMVWRNLVCACGNFLTRDQGIQDLADNYVTSRDPGFLDVANLKFQLRGDSPVYDRTGFQPIPVDEIGPYEHPCRATWPVSRGEIRYNLGSQ